jgi:hypothetical protein
MGTRVFPGDKATRGMQFNPHLQLMPRLSGAILTTVPVSLHGVEIDNFYTNARILI